ncbi:hypothetical protein O9993_00595 [Vibrio lentus]|nr:hypothetical protein [Vibrio lentus]
MRMKNEYKLLAQNDSTGYGLGKFNESFLNATNESALMIEKQHTKDAIDNKVLIDQAPE